MKSLKVKVVSAILIKGKRYNSAYKAASGYADIRCSEWYWPQFQELVKDPEKSKFHIDELDVKHLARKHRMYRRVLPIFEKMLG